MSMEGDLLKSLKKKPVTLRYPFEKVKPPERIQAKVSWNIDKCIGCRLCEKICPSMAIELEGKGKTAEIIYNVGKCIFCSECVTICPTKAIHTTKEYELAFTQPEHMIIEYRRTKK